MDVFKHAAPVPFRGFNSEPSSTAEPGTAKAAGVKQAGFILWIREALE
jgi:hypothetical protein